MSKYYVISKERNQEVEIRVLFEKEIINLATNHDDVPRRGFNLNQPAAAVKFLAGKHDHFSIYKTENDNNLKKFIKTAGTLGLGPEAREIVGYEVESVFHNLHVSSPINLTPTKIIDLDNMIIEVQLTVIYGNHYFSSNLDFTLVTHVYRDNKVLFVEDGDYSNLVSYINVITEGDLPQFTKDMGYMCPLEGVRLGIVNYIESLLNYDSPFTYTITEWRNTALTAQINS